MAARSSEMLELLVPMPAYEATLSGARRAHILRRVVGAPIAGEAVRIVEAGETGRACYARVTHVEEVPDLDIGVAYVLSLEVRMSTTRMPAVKF